ncbi:MAG: hypothetical protein ABEJ43_09685 [Haloferacaceae archaeon]
MTGDSGESPADSGPDTGPTGGRDVVVPLRLYKTVVVFSTLIAVVSVVLGFTLLDAATLQVSVVRALVVGLLSTVGVVPGEGALSAALAALGLGVIAFGAGVYTVGTRFRTAGMGNAEADADDTGE